MEISATDLPSSKKTKNILKEYISFYFQVVSICERNPQVLPRLKPDTKNVIKEKR
jgi:hypothetical protein